MHRGTGCVRGACSRGLSRLFQLWLPASFNCQLCNCTALHRGGVCLEMGIFAAHTGLALLCVTNWVSGPAPIDAVPALLRCSGPRAHISAQAEDAELPVQGYQPKVVAMGVLSAGFRLWAPDCGGQCHPPKQHTQLGDNVTGLGG